MGAYFGTDSDPAQVGDVEVDRSVLDGPGEPLEAFLAGRPLGDLPLDWAGRLPSAGWREVGIRSSVTGPPVPVIAAPTPDYPGGFALISLVERRGKVFPSGDLGPLPVRPSKAVRRRGSGWNGQTP